MSILKYVLAFSCGGCAVPPALACFTVYNAGNQPVYSNMAPPIDMSYQIHQRLPATFPGGHLVFGNSTDCPDIDVRKMTVALSNVSATTAVPVVRIRRTSQAERNRAQDALTK